MEDKILIEKFRWYTTVTKEQEQKLKDFLLASDSKELILIPDLTSRDTYKGILLGKYYTPILGDILGVREVKQEGVFQCIMVYHMSLRSFFSSLSRRMQHSAARVQDPTLKEEDMPLDFILMDKVQESSSSDPADSDQDKVLNLENRKIMNFLKTKSPALIERELNEKVIGQSELTKCVADFLYYHALRQIHPDLPQRPLLVAGPSGSGKTEVWRVASRLYSDVFTIKIVDGSNLSCEGWSGNFKIDTYMDAVMVNGGILVVDEFDKLTKPKHSSSGENISLDIQAEFLKLVEGEYIVTERRKITNMTSKKMGFVLVGAFESLRKQKEGQYTAAPSQIGFCAAPKAAAPISQPVIKFTDEDYIAYGMMPELVGRIAAKCTTAPLDDQAYLNIICGPHSRVAMISQVLKQYGVDLADVLSAEEIKALVAKSQSNKTGVRWVSSQVETHLLDAIRERGLFPTRANAS